MAISCAACAAGARTVAREPATPAIASCTQKSAFLFQDSAEICKGALSEGDTQRLTIYSFNENAEHQRANSRTFCSLVNAGIFTALRATDLAARAGREPERTATGMILLSCRRDQRCCSITSDPAT
jgi:hypothetical protein